MKCRSCKKNHLSKAIDLGYSPISNNYLEESDLKCYEKHYPLRIWLCESCFLLQTEDYQQASEHFNENYAYFSSMSESWLKHAKKYTDMIVRKLKLDENSYVVEIASNDGYLLSNFVERKIPCLGIEPTNSTAEISKKKGIPTLVDFFSYSLSRKMATRKADLIICNNVIAHVPDIRDFIKGLRNMLINNGTITIEFPHALNIISQNQFDTIYHEHYSYFSLLSLINLLEFEELRVYNIHKIRTHGGSLRAFVCHKKSQYKTDKNVFSIIETEMKFGLNLLKKYELLQKRCEEIKIKSLEFLIKSKNKKLKICGYGAAAKGNTFINYAGIKTDLIPFVSDRALSKQGKYLPGSHIPVYSVDKIYEYKPDLVIILPWNIKDEICNELSIIREWGGEFVTFIPKIRTF